MWLPIMKAALYLYPNLFKEVTLYAPSYRGIFGCVKHGVDISQPYDDRDSQNVVVTLDKCGDDVVEIMKHAGLKKLDMIICWSLGAQMSISCVAKHKINVEKLFLMNPAIGNTVQKAFQPFFPLPVFIQKVLGKSAIALLHSLKTILKYDAWFVLKKMSDSLLLRLFLEILSFVGGFPPEQAPFFQQYMRDAFSSQYHTRGLLDLIISLDAPCSTEALSLTCPTIVLSGLPDFMTGIYNSYELLKTMPQAKHVVFTMASHFLLLEWPDLVAKELVQFIFE
jgi:pimeloyl-ACP methyl ester carboxylesterase